MPSAPVHGAVDALRAAFNERTAALFCLGKEDSHAIPLDRVIEIAHAAAVPVIVDAASECPPLSTLTRFNKAGADLVIFSGGKSLHSCPSINRSAAG